MPLKVAKRADRPPYFWITGTVHGRRVRQSSGTIVRAHAEEMRAKLESDIFKERVYGARAVATFADAAVAYMEAGGEAEHLGPIIVAIGNRPLKDIDQALVDQLARAKPTVKPSTHIRRLYTPISAVMNHAHGMKLCDPMRLRKPKVRNGRTEYLLPGEAEAWIQSLPEYLRGLFVFYVATGCRATEALSLQWKDVSPGGRVVFWDTKEDYARGANLPARAIEALPERRDSGFVFLNSRGEPWHGYDAINLMLRKHQRANPKLRPVHCHLLRHTWATWAYAVTRDLTFVLSRGGWRSLALLGRYTHAASEDLAEDVVSAGWHQSDTKWV